MPNHKLLVKPLYAALSLVAQAEAMAAAPAGTRKAILSTNIAETSLTIDGVKFVVDSGLVKTRAYDATRGVDSLMTIPVSRAGARQRKGRAGRQSAGKCFRLYTEPTFHDELEDMAVPEVLRTSLTSTVLVLKKFGISNVLNFDFIAPPPPDALAAALEELLMLGALDDHGELTSDGHLLSALPVDPVYGRALLAARDCICISHMIALISIMCADGALLISRRSYADDDEAAPLHVAFASPNGDTPTAVAIFAAYDGIRLSKNVHEKNNNRSQHPARRWCESQSINWKTLETALRIRLQLQSALQRLGISKSAALLDAPLTPLGVESGRELRRSLTAAFFGRAAYRQPSGEYMTYGSGHSVSIHPSSVLFGRRPQCVLYSELVFTTKLFMRFVTVIRSEWLAELAPQLFS